MRPGSRINDAIRINELLPSLCTIALAPCMCDISGHSQAGGADTHLQERIKVLTAEGVCVSLVCVLTEVAYFLLEITQPCMPGLKHRLWVSGERSWIYCVFYRYHRESIENPRWSAVTNLKVALLVLPPTRSENICRSKSISPRGMTRKEE